jgi:hypothetical protein
MLGFGRWKGLSECVRHHIVCRAIDELELAISDYPVDEMESDIDVLRSGVILVVLGKCDGRLIV